MGKSRRNRHTAARSDPISKPPKTVKPLADPELAALRDAKVLPVLKNLSSIQPQDRTTAAQAIANLVQDTKCRKLLLRDQIVPIVLTETLTDSALESKAAGWFILKVIANEEDADFCIHLYRQDVLTAIDYAARKALAQIDPGLQPQPSKAELKFSWNIIACLASLIAELASASDDLRHSVNNVLATGQLLMAVLCDRSAPEEVYDEVLSSLLVLSEDNDPLAERILNYDEGKSHRVLIELSKSEASRAVPACGILHSVSLATGDFDDAELIEPLSRALQGPISTQTNGNGDGDDHHSTDRWESKLLALEILASIGTAVQQALELGDNIDDEDVMELEEKEAGEDDDDEMEEGHLGEDGDMEGDQDDEMDEDMAADLEKVTDGEAPVNGVVTLDQLPVLKGLIRTGIPSIISTITFPATSDDPDRTLGLALDGLNNIAWSVACIDFSDSRNDSICRAWRPAAIDIWEQIVAKILASDTADLDLATRVTCLAWAVARTLGGQVPLRGDEQRKFIALYNATRQPDKEAAEQDDEDPFQSLGVKCIGVLGQLALPPAPPALNREIGVFLTMTLRGLPETPAAEAVEALNQIFDAYAEDDGPCDKVLREDGLLAHLEEVLPLARAMAKGIDRRARRELRDRADEAVANLGRFIQYKKANK